ncbi:aminoglycoside phosphotransferase family protein [Kribbella sp. NPDC026596]|uniref:aminoglycoside phosphotransferase family protein n=1 Tax=Kribbella sp. NPDC026596 TaxID=3155122 RepID=UPI0033EF7E93
MTILSCDERDRLDAALHEVAAKAGIDPTDARLLRYTMNAVFYAPAADVVLRIAPADNVREVRQVAAVATRLAELDLPTVRLAPGFEEPIETSAWAATAWTYLPQPSGHRHQLVDLAAPLLSIHSIHRLGLAIPEWDVIDRCEDRVRKIAEATGEAMDYLEAWAKRELNLPIHHLVDRLLQHCAELRLAVAAARWALPVSIIHGDAHAGNLLTASDGVVLIDLDSIRFGPPEWDLVPAAHGVERFADALSEYEDFASAYGFDLFSSPNWPVLLDVRDLQLVTSVIAKLLGRPNVAEELGHRLRSYFAKNAATWHRFR